MGAKGLTPEVIREFSFESLALLFVQDAPNLWKLVCTLCDVSADQMDKFLYHEDLQHEAVEDFDADPEGGVEVEETPRRRSRQKALIAAIAIGSIAFARSRRCNRLQMVMGLYLFASRAGKRVIAVLNHLGLCMSYTTVLTALKLNAQKEEDELRQRVKTEAVGITYDNLTNHNKVSSETLFNKSVLYCFTAAAVFFICMTESLALRLCRAVHGLKEACTLRPELRLPGETAAQFNRRLRYCNGADELPAPEADAAPRSVGPMLQDQLLFAKPSWDSLTAEEVLNDDVLAEYWPKVARGIICNVLRKHYETEIKESGEDGYDVPVLHQLEPIRSEVRTLATMKLDESTIEGNIEVLHNIVEQQLGYSLDELVDKVIPVSGDQMTLMRIASAQKLRVRDFDKFRLLWARTQTGLLHLRMAAIHMVYLAHWGRKDGRDPASLAKFAKQLGRTKVDEKTVDLNASHELLTQNLEAHVLAAMIENGCNGRLDGLKDLMKSNRWPQVVDSVVDTFLNRSKVGELRDKARDAARRSLENLQPDDVELEITKDAAVEKAKEEFQNEQDKHRDIAWENAVLFLQHALIYTDFHTAVRSGDTGRVETSVNMLGILFQGVTKLKHYRFETLNMIATRLKQWKPAMREIWLYVMARGLRIYSLSCADFT
jgi:hypothetical protein